MSPAAALAVVLLCEPALAAARRIDARPARLAPLPASVKEPPASAASAKPAGAAVEPAAEVPREALGEAARAAVLPEAGPVFDGGAAAPGGASPELPPDPPARSFLGVNVTLKPRLKLDETGRLRSTMVDPAAPGLRILDWIPKVLGPVLGMPGFERVIRAADELRRGGMDAWAAIARAMKLRVHSTGLEHVPQAGPLIVVANHPLHGVDGAAAVEALLGVRSDFKVVATAAMEGVPGLSERALWVEPFDIPGARRSRRAVLDEAAAWAAAGHAVFIFPAGEPSSVPGKDGRVLDVRWKRGAAAVARASGARVVPLFVGGRPGRLSVALKKWLPPTAALLNVREIMRHRGSGVKLTFGAPVLPSEAADEAALSKLLRERVYALER